MMPNACCAPSSRLPISASPSRLRLHEAGMIESLPNKIIAENTDWCFLNELKRELKV